MIPYIFHASILLAGSFACYWLLLRKETFFQLNRWILLGSIILSLSLPFITVTDEFSFHQAEVIYVTPIMESDGEKFALSAGENIRANNQEFNKIALAQPAEQMAITAGSVSVSPVNKSINWIQLLWMTYLAGVLAFTLAFLLQFGALIWQILRLPSIKDGKFRIVEINKDKAPYSFLNCIFINPANYDLETFNLIIAHEKIHIQQVHFFDKILVELLLIGFWFNPFVWFYRKAITNNLEYLTDDSLIDRGTEKATYQMSLLKVSVPNVPLNLTTNYNQSFLKNRIAMMNASKSSLSSSWKYLILLPIIALSVATLNAVEKRVESTPNLSTLEAVDLDATTAIKNTDLKSKRADGASKKAIASLTTKMDSLDPKPRPGRSSSLKGNAHSNPKASANNNVSKHSTITRKTYYSEGPNVTIVKDGKVTYFKSNDTEVIHDGDHFSHSDLKPGEWKGDIKGNAFCLTLNNSDPSNSWTSYVSNCIPSKEFENLPRNGKGDFTLTREAGTLYMSGTITDDSGKGVFRFEPNQNFVSYLKSQGIHPKDNRQTFHLFFNNVNKEYVEFLKKSGFEVDLDGVLALSVHAIDRVELKEFMQIFEELNNKDYNLNDLVQFKIHDVTPKYVNEIRALGLDLTTNQVVQAKIHDVEPNYIKEMQNNGFKDIDMNQIVQFAIHDVDIAYIKSMNALGYDDLGTNEIVQASIHDVDPNFIKEMRNLGFTDLELNDVIQFSIHDVDAATVKAFKNARIKGLTKDQIIQAAIHDVEPSFIKEVAATGMENMDMNQMVQFAIHDIDVEYIKSFKQLGLKNLGNQDIIQFGIHDIEADYIRKIKAAGFKDLSNNDIVQAGIHDVEPEFIKGVKALGMKTDGFSDIIQASIHNLTIDFIKEMRTKGHNSDKLDFYTKLRIHGH